MYPWNQQTAQALFEQLHTYRGDCHWWPVHADSADPALEMMIGAILTQNTAWSNVEKALENLRVLGIGRELLALDQVSLCEALRPSGFYRQKAVRVRCFLAWFALFDLRVENLADMPTAALRKTLLSLLGIGPETADAMLVYAFKRPSFIIDAYTRRVLSRIGYESAEFWQTAPYEDLRERMESVLPPDAAFYGEFHGQIDMHAKDFCRAKPLCAQCHIKNCVFFQN